MAAGLFFDLVGCLGLVRLPDVYNRLQAGTKCVTLGTFLILVVIPCAYGVLEDLLALSRRPLDTLRRVARDEPVHA